MQFCPLLLNVCVESLSFKNKKTEGLGPLRSSSGSRSSSTENSQCPMILSTQSFSEEFLAIHNC